MPRDNFSNGTRHRLSDQVDHHCVFPGCWTLTSVPRPEGKGRVTVSHAAHVSAASENGPRYNPELTPEQRRALANGANLCATHATLVDRQSDRYPAETIQGWQGAAVETLQRNVGRPTFHALADRRQAVTAVENFFRYLNRCPRTAKGYFSGEDLRSIQELLHACRWSFPTFAAGTGESFTASNPLHAGDVHAAKIQLTILAHLAFVRWEVLRHDGEWQRDGQGAVLKPHDPYRSMPAVFADDARLRRLQTSFDAIEHERSQLRAYLADDNTYTL